MKKHYDVTKLTDELSKSVFFQEPEKAPKHQVTKAPELQRDRAPSNQTTKAIKQKSTEAPEDQSTQVGNNFADKRPKLQSTKALKVLKTLIIMSIAKAAAS